MFTQPYDLKVYIITHLIHIEFYNIIVAVTWTYIQPEIVIFVM